MKCPKVLTRCRNIKSAPVQRSVALQGEPKASDWGWFEGRMVALDYSTRHGRAILKLRRRAGACARSRARTWWLRWCGAGARRRTGRAAIAPAGVDRSWRGHGAGLSTACHGHAEGASAPDVALPGAGDLRCPARHRTSGEDQNACSVL